MFIFVYSGGSDNATWIPPTSGYYKMEAFVVAHENHELAIKLNLDGDENSIDFIYQNRTLAVEPGMQLTSVKLWSCLFPAYFYNWVISSAALQ